MSKGFKASLLMDYYGCLLTDKQRNIADCYYNEDLSLAEIAENEGISRQGVHESVTRSYELLCEYDSKLGLIEKDINLKELAEKALNNETSKETLCEYIKNL